MPLDLAFSRCRTSGHADEEVKELLRGGVGGHQADLRTPMSHLGCAIEQVVLNRLEGKEFYAC